jgi:hypothetical protein
VQVILALGDFQQVTVHELVGGMSVSKDIRAIRQGVQVVVGTVGRVLDMVNRKILNPKQIKMLVLDEADDQLSGMYFASYHHEDWPQPRREIKFTPCFRFTIACAVVDLVSYRPFPTKYSAYFAAPPYHQTHWKWQTNS